MSHINFDNIPPGIKPVIIIRHAERFAITKMIHAMEVVLTENGKADSELLGEKICGFAPFVIYHSPVKRCEQTAHFINQGINRCGGDAKTAGPHFQLGGPYIKNNWPDISSAVEKTGHLTFVRKWFDGNLSPDLIVPLPEVAEIKLKLVKEFLLTGKSVIAVTHDWNLMVMKEFFFGQKHEDLGLPDYLDGIIAYEQGQDLFMISGSKTIRLG